MKGKPNLSSNRITSCILDFYVFENFDMLSQAPGVWCLTHLSLASILWDVSKRADPDQKPHNHGGVGSGSPLLFAVNLNKKRKTPKTPHPPPPTKWLWALQKMKMGNSIRHVWVNIKCKTRNFRNAVSWNITCTIFVMNTIWSISFMFKWY